MSLINVLIGCEESGKVSKAFRENGLIAYSCDILPTRGDPEWHIQGDIFEAINTGVPGTGEKWDALIAFPPCTYLTTAANRHFTKENLEKEPWRITARTDAVDFFKRLFECDINYVALENPAGNVINTLYKKPSQIIQPFYFGDANQKRTGLWLKNLPPLMATKFVGEGEKRIRTHGKTKGKVEPVWYYKNTTDGVSRQQHRAVTFDGIAAAMGRQWGEFLKLEFGGER